MQSETFANWELQGVSLRWKSTQLEVLCKNSFLKDFAKFAEKHLRRSVFLGEQLHQKRDAPVFFFSVSWKSYQELVPVNNFTSRQHLF